MPPTASVYADDYDGTLSVEVLGTFNVVYKDYFGRESEDYDLDMSGTVDLTSGTPVVTFDDGWDW